MSLSPTVQLAQDRLREFMDQHDATWPEMEHVIGLDAGKLKTLLKQKAGPNMYSAVVLEHLGAESLDATTNKLDAVRVAAGKSIHRGRELKGDDDMTIQKQALEMFNKFKTEHGYNEKQASLAIGKGASSVAAMRSTFNNGKFGERSAQGLIDAIRAYNPASVKTVARDKSATATGNIVKANSVPIPTPHDPVNSPEHYTSHDSGIECIEVTERMNFCIGNAVKYLWLTDMKGDPIENMRKAAWYIEREIQRRQAA